MVNGVYVDNIETLDTNLVDVMFASFSYAGFFPPAESMGGTWFDGAVIWDVDVFSAVNKCMETHAPADIVVDVLLTSQKSLSHVDASNFNTLHTLLRAGRILRYYSIMDGLLRAQFAYPDITFRNIISPSADLDHNLLPLVSPASRYLLLFCLASRLELGGRKLPAWVRGQHSKLFGCD